MNIYLSVCEYLCECIYFILILVCVLKEEQVVCKFRKKYFQPKSAPGLKEMIITSEEVNSLPGKAIQITGDQHEESVGLTNRKFSFKELQP